MKQATVIISFYKRTDYLRLILAGFERQSFTGFEIIIADDGSDQAVINDIEHIASCSPLDIRHIWHEDKGFRKNKILNQAISISELPYLIFIDGDCIPHKEFTAEHIANSSPGICITGRRVNLSEKITAHLSAEKIKNGWLEGVFNPLTMDGIFGGSYDVEKGFYIKNKALRNFINKKKRGILGCNFSLYKTDMLSINGFDERYEAPSIGEDSDIQYRLELNNIRIKSLNNIAVQYHLYHKLQPRPEENLRLFARIREEGKFYTPFGIKK